MEQFPFWLSNSMLRDWEDMCPIQWKARWIDKDPRMEIEGQEGSPMRWGVFFETMVIGSGMGGKTIELTATEKKSVMYERVKEQAARCRKYLKVFGGKIVGRQEYLRAVIDVNGQKIPIAGNLDIRHSFGDIGGIIDLKLTGDSDNTFGKFAWGDPGRMDMSQIFQYKILYQETFAPTYVPYTHYWVFDMRAEMKVSLLDVVIDPLSEEAHKFRLAKAYNEICASLALDDWIPKNTFNKCNVCPIKCEYERIMPEFIQISK